MNKNYCKYYDIIFTNFVNIIPKSTQARTENKKFEVSDFTIKLYSFFLLNYNKLYILNAENKRVERLSAEHNI